MKYIKLYESYIEDGKIKGELPETLYHATYESYLPYIMKEGLGGQSMKRSWDYSKMGVVYFALHSEMAADFCEYADVPDEINGYWDSYP